MLRESSLTRVHRLTPRSDPCRGRRRRHCVAARNLPSLNSREFSCVVHSTGIRVAKSVLRIPLHFCSARFPLTTKLSQATFGLPRNRRDGNFNYLYFAGFATNIGRAAGRISSSLNLIELAKKRTDSHEVA